LFENAPNCEIGNLLRLFSHEKYRRNRKGLDKLLFKDIELKASELKFKQFQYKRQEKIDMIVYLKTSLSITPIKIF